MFYWLRNIPSHVSWYHLIPFHLFFSESNLEIILLLLFNHPNLQVSKQPTNLILPFSVLLIIYMCGCVVCGSPLMRFKGGVLFVHFLKSNIQTVVCIFLQSTAAFLKVAHDLKVKRKPLSYLDWSSTPHGKVPPKSALDTYGTWSPSVHRNPKENEVGMK